MEIFTSFLCHTPSCIGTYLWHCTNICTVGLHYMRVLRPLCWTNWTQTQTNKEPLKLHAGQLWVWIGCQTLLQKYFHSCKFEKIPLAYYPGPETWFLYFHVGRSNWRTQPSCTDFNKKHIWLIIDLWQTVSSIPFSGDHGWFYVPGKNPSTWFIYLPGER